MASPVSPYKRHQVRTRKIRSDATVQRSKAYRCPTCGKRKMYVLLLGEEAGRLKKCENCGYTNRQGFTSADSSTWISYG